MSVRGRTVVHCHGKKKGKVIARHKTKKAARRHHRAIVANKKRKK